MRKRYILIAVVLVAVVVFAGNQDPTNPPGSTHSYTLEDIYQRLTTGNYFTPSTFSEPTSGPGTPTMHTLNEIMDIAPEQDNTDGAVTDSVLAGKTFWGLTSGQWGPQTGTMPNNGAVTYTPGTTDQAVTAGYHNGLGKVEGDADLVPGNIKYGVNIFSVTGSLMPGATTNIVPKTGDTYDDPCCTGEDGETQYGIEWVKTPSFSETGAYTISSWTGVRFTDMGDGTVTDNLTGLIWLKNANCFGQRDWPTALSDANGLASGSCGLTDGSSAGDWRLPNVNELHSLFDLTETNPALPDGHPFTDVQSSPTGSLCDYWSSTTYWGDPSAGAWIVYTWGGLVGVRNKVSDFCYVWPVRGGQ